MWIYRKGKDKIKMSYERIIFEVIAKKVLVDDSIRIGFSHEPGNHKVIENYGVINTHTMPVRPTWFDLDSSEPDPSLMELWYESICLKG